MSACFALHDTDGSLQILELAGREEWALSHLLAAGATGCTSFSHPGIDITTLAEPHGGPFAGTHGRYILRSKVVDPLIDLQVAA
jgi:hypothetical protein